MIRRDHAGHLAQLAASATLLALITPAGAATADEFHYQSLLMGNRAIGLGGAFTGIADDPSAAFYNPGGLAQLAADGVSISLSVNAFERREIDNGLVSEVGTADLVHKGRPTVPVSATLTVKLGKKDPDRVRPHSVAFSTFTRDRQDLDYDARMGGQLPEDPTRRRALEGEVHSERSEVWYGPSYSYRVSPRLSFGVSLFVSVLERKHEARGTTFEAQADGPFIPEMPYPSPLFTQRQHGVDLTLYRLVLRVGAYYKPLDNLSLGLMIQTPSLHLQSKGDLTERLITANGSTNEGTLSDVKRKLSARDPDPWEIRVGAGYRPTSWLRLSLDVSAYGPTGSARDPIDSPRIKPSPDPNDYEPGFSDVFMSRWYRHATGNVSVGAELNLGKYVTLSTGFFTDLSAAPPIQETAYSYTEPDVNHFGVSWLVGLKRGRYNLSAGALALWGRGKGYAERLDALPGEPPLSRTAVRDRTFYVFLSGYMHAAEQAVTQISKKISEPEEKKPKP